MDRLDTALEVRLTEAYPQVLDRAAAPRQRSWRSAVVARNNGTVYSIRASGGGTLTLAAGATAAFLVLASAIDGGMATEFDAWGMLALRNPIDASRPFGPSWLVEGARDFTALGSNVILGAITIVSSVLLALARRRGQAALLLCSFWGALVLDAIAKQLVGRARPGIVPHSALVFTSSFPSSHAAVSAAVLLATAVLVSRAGSGSGLRTVVVAAAAILFAVLVGLSRIYLGLHWPTDVLAGWMLGTAWTGLCWHVSDRVSACRSLP